MALKNKENNEYHKVICEEHTLMKDSILIQVYENEEHRTEGDTSFKKYYNKHLTVDVIDVLCKHTNNNDLSSEDNYKISMYNYLKTLDEYQNYEDC